MKLKNLFGHSIALVKKQDYVVKCYFSVESKEYWNYTLRRTSYKLYWDLNAQPEIQILKLI